MRFSTASTVARGVLAIGVFLSAHTTIWAQKPQLEKREEGDSANRRAEWFYGQRAYPVGRIPAGARLHAMQEMQRQRPADAMKRGLESRVANGTLKPALVSTTTWTPIGPQPTVYSHASYASTSGRVESLAVDPRNPNVVYLGSALGGVWKTTDGGTNWIPLTDTQTSLAMGGMAIDPNAPDTIYAATGEGGALFGYDAYYGAGILKSTDGGASWTMIATSTFQGPFSTSRSCGGGFISSIAVQPGHSSVLLAAAYICGTYGVYRSVDGGNTWTSTLSGLAYEVYFDPMNPTNAYTGLGTQFGVNSAATGMYKSSDGGQTWNAINGSGSNMFPTTNVRRIAFAVAPSQPSTIYAGVGAKDTNQLLGFFKTIDGGQTWTSIPRSALPDYCTDFDSKGNVVSPQCWYDNVVGVHPTNPNVVYVGGASSNGTSVFQSLDGGTTWNRVTPVTAGEGLHADTHAFAFSADGGKLYTGNDGGVWSTTNTQSATPTWTNLNATLSLTQFYPGIGIDPTNVSDMFGGTQDNGTQLYSGTSSWLGYTCGDGGWNVIDNTGTNAYLSCTGTKAIAKLTPTTGAFLNLGAISDTRYNFEPPMTADLQAFNNLYFGTYRVWQSQDAGTTWVAISPDLTKGFGTVTTLAVSPANSSVVWATTSDGKVQVTTNAIAGINATWTDRTGTLPNRALTMVIADPKDASTAYVTFSGFSAFPGVSKGHIFKTTDSGATWIDITGDLEPVDVPVNSIAIDPDIPGTYYAATDVGVFMTSNGGANWTTLMNGLPRAVVLDIRLHRQSRILRAATHGRGMFDLWVPLQTSTPTLLLSPTSLNFGSQGVGTTSGIRSIAVAASGGGVSVTSVASSSAEFPVTTNCSGTLAGGSSCSINVGFLPGGGGTRTGTLTLTSSGAGSPQVINVTGFGAGTLLLAPSSLNFGAQVIGQSSVGQSVTLTAMNANVTFSGFFTSSTTEWPGSVSCPQPLPASTSCTVTMRFVPTALGPRTGAMTVTSNAVAASQVVPMSGIGVATQSVTPQSGWWWDSNLSGSGFFVEYGGKSGTGMFVGGYVYDGSGNATWLVSTGAMSGSTYASNWLKVSGGQTLLGAYKAPTSTTSAGSLTINFTDSTHAVMTRPDGTQINLARFSFSGATPTPPVAGAPQSGWWWGGSALSGTGYGIEIQGSSVFIVAYMYDDAGNPVWYLATGSLTSPTSYTGTWDVYAGGPQLTSPEGSFGTHKVSSASPMSMTFSDATHGTLTMGSVSVPIQRFQEF
jgi:hypothetical protein